MIWKKIKKSSVAVLFRGLKETHHLVPGKIYVIISNSAVNAATPFINIYFAAKIIGILTTTLDKNDLFLHVIIAAFLNLICFILNKTLNQKNNALGEMLYAKEMIRVSQVLHEVNYEILESPNYQETVQQYKTGKEQYGTCLSRLGWIVSNWISSIVTLGFSISLLLPFLKVCMVPTGDSFFEGSWFFVVVLLSIAIAVVFVLLYSKHINKEWYEMYEGYTIINRMYDYYMSKILSSHENGKEIRIYNESPLIKNHATRELVDRGMDFHDRIAVNNAKSGAIFALVGGLLACGVYLLIAIKAMAGLFDLKALLIYVGSFLQVVQGIITFANSLGQTNVVTKMLKFYFEIVDGKSSLKESKEKLELSIDDNYVIEFRNVSFKYPRSEKYALKNFSIKINSNERLAVVGCNGSGKTTFIKLLCRMYRPQEGEILLNNVNIQDYDEEEYMKMFSVVFQDYQLFSYPLGQNVAANVDYDEDRIWACLTASGISDRVKLMPQELNTLLFKKSDNDGIEISGGESQKLALSRALYKNSPFIILDEPTASMDPITEFEIYNKFNNLVENKTAIYISHRLSSCKFCSHIAVFDKGQLIQFGTHEDLLKEEDGKYFELWNAQAQYYLNPIA